VLEGNARARNGILLFGSPGNGKTLFAEALAGQLGVPFVSIAYGDAASKWGNETPQKVKDVFSEAKKAGACVFFIDEIDSFIKSRNGSEHAMDRDLTNVMLTETVALRGSQVILVAATNLIDAVDGAAIRDGRFDYKIEIPAPDLNARVALLARSVREDLGDEFVDDEAIMALAKRWEGFSAARLSSLGAQLRELHRDGHFHGAVTVKTGMRAMRLLQGRRGALPENVKDIADIVRPDASSSMGLLGRARPRRQWLSQRQVAGRFSLSPAPRSSRTRDRGIVPGGKRATSGRRSFSSMWRTAFSRIDDIPDTASLPKKSLLR
jgi:transitional endoplasmic reticulum ATPase